MANSRDRRAFLYVGRRGPDRDAFRQVVDAVGGTSIETDRAIDALALVGRVEVVVLTDDLEDVPALELARLVRKVHPDVWIVYGASAETLSLAAHAKRSGLVRAVVERPFRASVLAQAVGAPVTPACIAAQSEEELPLVLTTAKIPTPPPQITSSADVLIVEDDTLVLRMLDRMLRGDGYVTYTAPSAAPALDVLRSTRFALLLLDVALPLQSGLSLARSIRSGAAGAANRHVPIVFVTADDSEATYEESFEVSAFGYIRKPFNPEELRYTVQSVLHRAH